MTRPAGSLRILHMQRPLNDRQRAVLDWLAADPDDAPRVLGYKNVAIALQTRGPAKVSRLRGVWTATLTDAGRYYHENGCYPPAGPNRPLPGRGNSARIGVARDRKAEAAHDPGQEAAA